MKYAVVIELTEPLLGTVPKNEEVYKTWVEIKKPREDEAEPEFDENKSWSGFHTDTTGLHLYDYQVKGFMKEAASILPEIMGIKKKSGESISGQTVKGKLDNWLFIFPRRIYFEPNKDKSDGYLERTMRVKTMRGDRVTLCRSDQVKAGTQIAFEIDVLDNCPITEEALRIWLKYGEKKGLGQWRNSSWGRFSVKSFNNI